MLRKKECLLTQDVVLTSIQRQMDAETTLCAYSRLIVIPAKTRRCFDVDSTSFERYGRQMDVETTLCAYCVLFAEQPGDRLRPAICRRIYFLSTVSRICKEKTVLGSVCFHFRKKSSHKKPPPVLAKKAALKQVANRKISAATTSLVHPSKTSVDLIRRGSHGGNVKTAITYNVFEYNI